jgi:predicted enzyme related to lactoylglutathione lyase
MGIALGGEASKLEALCFEIAPNAKSQSLGDHFKGRSVTNRKKNKEKNMLGLRTTIYKVGNIQKATEWYSKAFETNPYFNEPYYVRFNIQGYELGLQPEENPTLDKIESVVAYWGVENIQQTFDRLIELGASENEKPYNVGGEIMTATVKDPFGNIIGLIYNPEFQLN